MANYTILLIDYEPRSIERFRDPLLGAGYAIEIATDGVSGIEAFHRLNPDMVLVEAMIPKKHGFEVCQELKRTPHGRKTPVIITTGVYKGRKYRTQALHIYGCDEYIEKPIAPEQLLELVGKFLKPGSSGSPPKSTERGPSESEPAGPSTSHNTSSSGTQSVTTKPTLAPRAHSPSDSDDEISAHLDAILWGTGPAAPEAVAGVGTKLTAALDTIAVNPPELDAAADDDPFADIREELNAALGPPPPLLEFDSVPLQAVPDFIPSDQLPPPSILEALPIPEEELPSLEADLPSPEAEVATPEVEVPTAEVELPMVHSELPIPPAPEPAPIPLAERPGQVVDFDTKRSRKHKKSKHGKGRSGPVQTSHSTPPVPIAAPEEMPSPRVLDPVASVAELTLPRGTLVESELEAPVARRGIPVWVWAVAGIIAVIGIYFIFSRGTPDRSVVSAPSLASTNPAVNATSEPPPAPESVVPEALAPEAPPPQTPDPVPVLADPPTPVAETQQLPAPKKQADRPVKPKAVAARADSPPVRSAPKIESPAPPRPVPVAAAAPDGLGVSVAGVETLPDPAAAARPTLATGALIPIDEADTIPVSLLRRSPVYSEQARQMKASGTVIMNVLINERGSVDQAVLVTGVPVADLNESAIRAAKTWTYRPATKNGVPVKVWKSEQIVFKR